MQRLLFGCVTAGKDSKLDKLPRGESYKNTPLPATTTYLPTRLPETSIPSKFKVNDRVKYLFGQKGFIYEITSTPPEGGKGIHGYCWIKKVFPNNFGGVGEMMVRENDLTPA